MTEDTSGRSERSLFGQDVDLLESAAQTLEAIAGGLLGDDEKVRDVARAEARRLRSSIARDTPAGGLDTLLAGLTAEFAEVGLVVEYSTSGDCEVPAEVGGTVCDVLADALSDIVRFTEARTAFVRVSGADDGIAITVRDHGPPVLSDRPGIRLGPSRSLTVLLERLGGTVGISSEPGRGTRVSFLVPR
jgi:signal transduction histidine kinase